VIKRCPARPRNPDSWGATGEIVQGGKDCWYRGTLAVDPGARGPQNEKNTVDPGLGGESLFLGPGILPGDIPHIREKSPAFQSIEALMIAYLLLLVAVLTRVLPHAGMYNFTAVGGALLYFGARRSWREMLAPLAVLMATDYYLTVYAYHSPFNWGMYLPTWAWYAMAMALGQILLHSKTTLVRAGAGALLGPTSFFVVSNYAVWAMGTLYPHTAAGLGTCYVAGLLFYRNDLVSTAIVVAVAFGVPALLRAPAARQATAVRQPLAIRSH
jgi:hypothetical protein